MPTQPSPQKPAEKPDPNAHWGRVRAKFGKQLGAGGLAVVDAFGNLPDTGDPMHDLGRSLIRALGLLEKCIEQKRMKASDATRKQSELATMVQALALPAPAAPKVPEQPAETAAQPG